MQTDPSPGGATVHQEHARSLRRPDGAIISYRMVEPTSPGDAPALLLLHGLASNLTRWSEFVEHTVLTRTHPVIRVDLRGHGDSMNRRRVGLDLWCDDLRALLDDTGRGHALVIGHSLGAQVALHFAAKFPQRVAGIGLIDPLFPTALRFRWKFLRLGRPLLAAGAAAIRGLNALGLYRRDLPPRDLRELDRRARLALGSHQDEEAFVRQYSSTRADLRHVPLAVYVQDLVEMFRPAPLPQTLGVPVLVLLSTAGTFADPEQTTALLGGSPAVQVRLIHCHHWPLTERPDQVRRAIEDWCAGLPDGAASQGEPVQGLAP
jgi:pimeloyl-ACP methyl ester carboxylesterase